MIHIVFEPANKIALEKSFELDETLQGDIVTIQDDFAVGPINDLFTEEGTVNRLQWWKNILQNTPFESLTEDGHVDDEKEVQAIKDALHSNSEEVLWIWAAQNKHDVCGYYWLMSQLKEYQGRIFILYLNNLPFINDKGNIFYPTNLFQIPPKEFIKAKKLARPITLSEFEVDPDEWQKLAAEGKGVRLLEGGKKLGQKNYDFYDTELLKYLSKDYQKVNKIFTQYFSKVKETTGDAFLFWRLTQMAALAKVELQGNFKNVKETEARLMAAEPVEEINQP